MFKGWSLDEPLFFRQAPLLSARFEISISVNGQMVHGGFLITFLRCGVKRKRRAGGLKAAEIKHQNCSLSLYCLTMLSTFSCACHPYVFSGELLRFCPSFKLGCLFSRVVYSRSKSIISHVWQKISVAFFFFF